MSVQLGSRVPGIKSLGFLRLNLFVYRLPEEHWNLSTSSDFQVFSTDRTTAVRQDRWEGRTRKLKLSQLAAVSRFTPCPISFDRARPLQGYMMVD